MSRKTRQKSKHRKQQQHQREIPVAPIETRYRGREILRDVLKGLLFIAIVLSAKLIIERTTFGKHLELMSYSFLQTKLSAQPAPITIVDISDLPPKDFIVNRETVTATPREPLKEMIEALADQHARAIGIDVDFSPDENGYILPSDPDFFQFCLDTGKQRGVRVFLGIKRTIVKPPAEWMGDAKYEDLAANILIPKDSRRMVNLIQVGGEAGAGQNGKPSKAMSVQLADAYGVGGSGATFNRIHGFLIRPLASAGLVEKLSEKEIGPGVSVQDFLIDYGPLESIETIPVTDAAALREPNQRPRIEGKIVLIGDATLGKATDTFVVPGRDQPVPGILVHACAAYTMLKAPLYELTSRGHLVIDILLSGLILGAIILIGLRYGNLEAREQATNRLRGLFTWVTVIAAIVVGVVFVRLTRIMWDDFFLALILLVFHPSIEHKAEGLWKKIRKQSPVASHPRIAQEHD